MWGRRRRTAGATGTAGAEIRRTLQQRPGDVLGQRQVQVGRRPEEVHEVVQGCEEGGWGVVGFDEVEGAVGLPGVLVRFRVIASRPKRHSERERREDVNE